MYRVSTIRMGINPYQRTFKDYDSKTDANEHMNNTDIQSTEIMVCCKYASQLISNNLEKIEFIKINGKIHAF